MFEGTDRSLVPNPHCLSLGVGRLKQPCVPLTISPKCHEQVLSASQWQS